MEAPKLHGRFVWYDLMSPDFDGSKTFYTNVAGWTTEPFQPVPEMPPYTMWMADGTSIGGMMPLPEEGNVPPHWLLYIGADNVDKTVEDIRTNGGTVLEEPKDIPTVGRFAVCQDPQGATFAVFTPLENTPGLQGEPRPKFMSWHELASSDAETSLAFYRTIFGWGDAGTHDMGHMGNYHTFDAGAWPTGGAYTIPENMPIPTAWIPYIMTEGLHAACERVTSGGGQIMNGPMEVPGGSRVAVCLDAHGAAFGLHEAGEETPEAASEGSSEAAA